VALTLALVWLVPALTISDPPSADIRTLSCLFFFNHPATTEIYTLSLHDALPILPQGLLGYSEGTFEEAACSCEILVVHEQPAVRSEEHTSELQSRGHLVCRLLLEKKKHARRVRQHSFRAHDRSVVAPRRRPLGAA